MTAPTEESTTVLTTTLRALEVSAPHARPALGAVLRLLDREHLVQELIEACKHTKRVPSGRVMRAVKALEEFGS
jgi:hypothetical protein